MSEKFESDTLNDAYFDRNQAVMAFAAVCMGYAFPVGIKDDPEWPILFIKLPQGQVSWHIPKAELIGDWPAFEGEWDGHTLEQKRERITEFIKYLIED